MAPHPTPRLLIIHLLYAVGLAGVATLAARAPVAISTHPTTAPARSVEAPCSEPLPVSLSQTYRSLEELARLAARSEWQERVDALEDELQRERERAESAAAALRTARSPVDRGPLATAPILGTRPSPRKSTRARPARISAGAARVRLVGSDALVSGLLRNSGDRDASVRLIVELLVDHRVLDRARLRILVPARGAVPWSQSFSTSLEDGTYAARVRFDR